jgi:hypothetical protein
MRSFRRSWRVAVARCLLFTAAGIGYSGSPALAATASCGAAIDGFIGSAPITWQHLDQPRANLSAWTNNSFSLWSS